MMAGLKRSLRTTAGCIFLAVMSSSVFSQVDQTIYYQYCVARPDSVCFKPNEGAVDTVGRDVGALGGSFRFCLEVDTVDSGYAPVRVMLVLDRSGSMCRNPGAGTEGCCTPGDSSGNCMLNDPNNMRVQAANTFVDSLAAKSPQSWVGVVAYDSRATTNNPIQLNSAGNIETIHRWIDAAACAATTTGGGGGGAGKARAAGAPDALAKTAATTATYLGLGLQSGLRAVDNNYDEIPAGMSRHIIQLTDGAWDDIDATLASPDTIINRYKAQYPERPVPTVHGVFLSNSELHLAHGYPAEGCSNTEAVYLDKLKRATELMDPHGIFVPASTPQTIIAEFQKLLDTIANTAPQTLKSLNVTNAANGETRSNGTVTQAGGIATWQTTIQNLPVEFGPNALTLVYTITRPGRADSTITRHVTIFRSDKYREAIDSDLYKAYCDLVQANIKITASPATQTQNQPFDVKATIAGSTNFKLDTVQVRIFTRFVDADNGAIATFHLDGNLVNATGGADGIGTGTTYTSTDHLFGSEALVAGSFTYPLPQFASDFLIEEWVKPGSNGAAVLFTGNGIEIGVNAGMKLYLKTATATDTAISPLDDAVWSHIGVARSGGKVTLFVNGIAVSTPIDLAAAIPGGTMTILTPNKWVTDEVRFSSVSRMGNDGATKIIAIPTVTAPAWNLKGVASSGPVLKVAPGVWGDGKTYDSLAFTFASPDAGRILVNIRQKESGGVGTGWSKNSNPVFVAADVTGPYVKQGILTPGTLQSKFDTLKILFSEGVNCAGLKASSTPAGSFVVIRAGTDQSKLLEGSSYLEAGCPKEFLTEVLLLVPGGINPDSDSLRLTNVKAADSAGNPAVTNKKGDIIWGEGAQIDVVPIQSENPGNPMAIPPIIKTKLGIDPSVTDGKIVGITTRRDFKVITVKGKEAYGYAEIYDAVGNLMQAEVPIEKAKGVQRVFFVNWDCKNRQGRRVGTGAYLIRLHLPFADNTNGYEERKIAIKWK